VFTFVRPALRSNLGRLNLVLSLALGVAFLTRLTPASSTPTGDEVFIAGFTNGCYGAACAPGATATSGGLIFSNSTFSGTSANQFRAIGGNANPGSNFNNLGSISLSTAPQSYNTPFTLQVTFTAPQGFNGSNTTTFTATITGTVRSDNTGGVFIDFNNTPVLFTFSDPNCEPNPEAQPPSAGSTTCGDGSFSFGVNDVSIDPGQTVSLTGQVTGAAQTQPLTSTPTRTVTNTPTATFTEVANRETLIAQQTQTPVGTLVPTGTPTPTATATATSNAGHR
jgi:hypothetical protein